MKRNWILTVVVGLLVVSTGISCVNPTEGGNRSEVELGTVTGTARDATSGDGIAGAAISVEGLSGYATTTDADGSFSLDVPEGARVIRAVVAGYTFSPAAVTVVGRHTTVLGPNQLVGSPTLATGQLRIVLTWGEYPEDLDSHLLTPDGHHVYYGDQETADGDALLDTDDTSSYGPETVTIVTAHDGTYTYYVHDFDETSGLPGSDAAVEVYDADGLVESFSVPASGTGYYWHVFDLTFDGQTETFGLFAVDTIVDEEPSL